VDTSAALVEQNRLLGELTHDADMATAVPTCPGWTLRQLVAHVGRGHRWAATIVREKSDSPVDPRTVADGKPPADPEAALSWLHASATSLLDAVAATGADTPVWTFTGPKPAGWWIRQRLHEETVHRADAAVALGVPYVIEPELAADAVSEWLDLLAARRADEGPAALVPGETMHLHATDGAGEWMVHGGGVVISWEYGHGKGDAAVRGTASELMRAVFRRAPADSVEVLGDAAVWTRWLERTGF
jgi:uncharacterized protein (TIGR03083 family)